MSSQFLAYTWKETGQSVSFSLKNEGFSGGQFPKETAGEILEYFQIFSNETKVIAKNVHMWGCCEGCGISEPKINEPHCH